MIRRAQIHQLIVIPTILQRIEVCIRGVIDHYFIILSISFHIELVRAFVDVSISQNVLGRAMSGLLLIRNFLIHGAGGVQHQHDVRGHLLFHRSDLAGGKRLQRQRVGAVWLELGSLAQDQPVLFLIGCQSRRRKQRQHQNQRKQRRYSFFCCFSCTSHICFLPTLLSATTIFAAAAHILYSHVSRCSGAFAVVVSSVPLCSSKNAWNIASPSRRARAASSRVG